MGERFPDSAKAFAVAHWREISLSERLDALPWIAGPGGHGLPALGPLLKLLPPEEIQQVTFPLRMLAGEDAVAADSLAQDLFRDQRPSLRVLALALTADPIGGRAATSRGLARLLAGAADHDPAIRGAAYEGIGATIAMDSNQTPWGFPLLATGLRDPDRKVKEEVLRAISRVRRPVPGTFEEVRRLARPDSPNEVRESAIMALAAYRAEARPALIDLAGYLGDADVPFAETLLDAMSWIARGVVNVPSEATLAVRAYVAREDDPYSRNDGIRALEAFRDTSGLRALLHDRDTIVVEYAVRSLATVAPGDSALIAAIDDPRPALRGVLIMAFVPITLDGADRIHPASASGRLVLDSARAIAAALSSSGLIGHCYDVRWGPLDPARDFGVDSVYSQPPRTIAFQAGPSFWSAAGDFSAMVVPANGASDRVHPFGSWTWDQKTGALTARWSTGFSGVGLTATQSGDSLIGELHPFWDFPRDRQIAKVILTPTVCRAIRAPEPGAHW